MKAVNACEEFFLLVVESHILTGAMSVFDMESADAVPKNKQLFPTGCEKLPPKDKKKILLAASRALIDKFVHVASVGTGRKKKGKSTEVDHVLEYMHPKPCL